MQKPLQTQVEAPNSDAETTPMQVRDTADHRSPGGRLGHVVGEGFAGPCLRAQGSSGEDGAFAPCARGWVDRFRCLLRPGPAAAWRFRGSAGVWGESLGDWETLGQMRGCGRKEGG